MFQHVHVDERQLFEKPRIVSHECRFTGIVRVRGDKRRKDFLDWVRDERVWRFIVVVQTPGRVSQSCERGRAYLGRRQRRSRSRQERIFRELDVLVPERLGDGRDNTTRGETKE